MLFFKKGFKYHTGDDRQFENYKDVDIPKKIKLNIVENLIVDIRYPGKRLDPFLARSTEEKQY